jgi:hypothetical protein
MLVIEAIELLGIMLVIEAIDPEALLEITPESEVGIDVLLATIEAIELGIDVLLVITEEIEPLGINVLLAIIEEIGFAVKSLASLLDIAVFSDIERAETAAVGMIEVAELKPEWTFEFTSAAFDEIELFKAEPAAVLDKVIPLAGVGTISLALTTDLNGSLIEAFEIALSLMEEALSIIDDAKLAGVANDEPSLMDETDDIFSLITEEVGVIFSLESEDETSFSLAIEEDAIFSLIIEEGLIFSLTSEDATTFSFTIEEATTFSFTSEEGASFSLIADNAAFSCEEASFETSEEVAVGLTALSVVIEGCTCCSSPLNQFLTDPNTDHSEVVVGW